MVVGSKSESAGSDYQKSQTYCQNTIHNAFGVYTNALLCSPLSHYSILRKQGIRYTHIHMNYTQYKDKIVRAFKVALAGWPSSGHVSTLSDLTLVPEEPSPPHLLSWPCKQLLPML
jgi:hypothetical protein